VGRLVRKRPCPCGSGRPARDCCGRFRRFDEEEIASAYLRRQARVARDLICPFAPSALATLQAEAATLPEQTTAFTDALLVAREPVSSTLRGVVRLLERTAGAGPAPPTEVLRSTLRRADTPVARVAVAKAMVALREDGMVDEHLAAAALVELVGGRSPLTEAALLGAAGAIAGLADTADGAVRTRVLTGGRPATA